MVTPYFYINKTKMKDWYKVAIRFTHVIEDDKVKNVIEEYLYQGVSYADAELRATEMYQSRNNGFEIHKVTKMTLHEVIGQQDFESWYRSKVQYIIFDEKSKAEKRTTITLLVNANSVWNAFEILSSNLGTVDDYEITEITKTKILEVYPLEENANQIEEPEA